MAVSIRSVLCHESSSTQFSCQSFLYALVSVVFTHCIPNIPSPAPTFYVLSVLVNKRQRVLFNVVPDWWGQGADLLLRQAVLWIKKCLQFCILTWWEKQSCCNIRFRQVLTRVWLSFKLHHTQVMQSTTLEHSVHLISSSTANLFFFNTSIMCNTLYALFRQLMHPSC